MSWHGVSKILLNHLLAVSKVLPSFYLRKSKADQWAAALLFSCVTHVNDQDDLRPRRSINDGHMLDSRTQYTFANNPDLTVIQGDQFYISTTCKTNSQSSEVCTMNDFKLVFRAALVSAFGVQLAVSQVGYMLQYHDLDHFFMTEKIKNSGMGKFLI